MYVLLLMILSERTHDHLFCHNSQVKKYNFNKFVTSNRIINEIKEAVIITANF